MTFDDRTICTRFSIAHGQLYTPDHWNIDPTEDIGDL